MSKQKVFVQSLVNSNKTQLSQIIGSTQDPVAKQIVTQALIYINELEQTLSGVQPSALTQSRVNTVRNLLPTLGVQATFGGSGEDVFIEFEFPQPQQGTPDAKLEAATESSENVEVVADDIVKAGETDGIDQA